MIQDIFDIFGGVIIAIFGITFLLALAGSFDTPVISQITNLSIILIIVGIFSVLIQIIMKWFK